MKIVVVTWFSDNQPGFLDFSYRIRALCERHQVTLVARSPIVQQELKAATFQERIFETKSGSKWRLILYQIKVGIWARRAVPDVVVLLGSQIAAVTLWLSGLRTIVYWNEHPLHFADTRSGNPLKRAFSALVRWLAYAGVRRAELVMPISEGMNEDLLDHGVSSQKIRLVYMGVDDSFLWAPSDRAGERLPEVIRVIYAGTISKARGRDVMLEGLALARGRKIPVHLTLVGASESEMTYCLRRARDLDILDGIDIKGRVSGREIPGLLGKADAGICIWENQPYWQFNPPTKLFEYFVAGLPVLASNIRTHTRYIQHGKNGLIFDYSSVGFADVISELWRRRGQLAELRRRAQESGVEHRWSSIEPHFIEAVEGVVSTHS